MTLNVATLAVKIQANSDQAQQGIGGIIKLLAGGGGIALGAAAAGLAIAGIGVASVKMAGDFQAGLTSLVTGAGESQKNLQLVQNGILSLATQTGTSTKQLIDGMYMIESGGYHGAAGLAILKAAAEGAKVGNADLGVVADATDTILKNFGDTGLSASGAVNTLIATVARGKTHMQDLADSLSQVLPTASAAKVGLNDVMGAMATMTGEGVPAANAATYLRQTILALDAPSKQSKDALAAIGLSSTAVAGEMQKSLPGALQMIQDHLSKTYAVGSPQYVAALKDIAGGSKQMQGILDLTGTHLKTFGENTKGISTQAKQAGNSIAGWQQVQGTFNQKMDVLNQVVQTSLIKLGTGLLPIATKIAGFFADHLPGAIDAVSGAFGKIVAIGSSVITFFQNTGPAATAVKLILGVLAGAMLGMAASAIPALVTSIIASVTAFGAQTIAAGAAAIATLAALAPFIAVGAAIGAVVGIIILAVTHWQQITYAITHFGEVVTAAKTLVIQGFQNMLASIRNMVEGVLSLLSHIPGPVGAMASSVLNGMKAADDATKAHTLSMQTATEMHTAAMAASALKNTDTMRQSILRELANTTDPAKKKALEMKLGVVEHTEQMQKEAVAKATKLAQEHTAQMQKLKADAVQRAKDAKLGVLGHIGEMKDNAITAVKNLAGTLIGWFIDLEIKLPLHILGMAKDALGKVKDFVGALLGRIGWMKDQAINKFNQIKDGITHALAALPGDMLTLGTNLIQNLINGITGMAGKLGTAVKGVLSNIPGVGGLANAAGGLMSQLPHFAEGGVMPGAGGVALVGEKGPELVNMPGGARIMPLAALPGGTPLYGTQGTMNGQPMQVTLVVDGKKLATAVLKAQPGVIRNATGARNF